MSATHGERAREDAGAAARRLSIHSLDASAEAEWDAYVQAHSMGSHYHLTRWRSLLGDLFGHETHYLLARGEGGGVAGVLPLVRLRSRLFGDFLVSMPFLNRGGAIGDDARVEDALMTHACRLAEEARMSHVEFRDMAPRDGPWQCRTDKVVMARALPATAEQLWRELGAKVRAQVKRPRKEGAVAEVGGAELVPAFFSVFARNMRDLGTPVYPQRFFERIAETFADATRVVVVRLAGRPVAAGVLLGHRGCVEIPWASSLREHNRSAVNMLLYWRALEHAIEERFTAFDFGRSSRDSGALRFKRQWGAEPAQAYWHYWLGRGRELPALTPDNPKYRLAIAAWKRLPVALANRVGPLIVRNLP